MKKNQKAKVVTVDWTWDSDKHDDLMRSIKEIMEGKPVPPLSGSTAKGGHHEP